ncbi:MAG: hypothetical protein K0U93_00185 [Gammaproteobacteria bacterium]|nr:hypothetical protein [Gammaproteobacteria bacterium]
MLIGGLTSLPLVIFSLAGPIGGKADVLTTLAWVGVWTAQVGILVGLVCLFIGLYAARTAKHRRKG